MKSLEKLIDTAIDTAIDAAVNILNAKKQLNVFCFFVNSDGCFTSVVPNETEFNFDESYIVDSFKDFGNEKMEDAGTEGYCITYSQTVKLHGTETDAIVVFLKLKNDLLPLKTRIYYYPYNFVDGRPFVDFESAFASEN